MAKAGLLPGTAGPLYFNAAEIVRFWPLHFKSNTIESIINPTSL